MLQCKTVVGQKWNRKGKTNMEQEGNAVTPKSKEDKGSYMCSCEWRRAESELLGEDRSTLPTSSHLLPYHLFSFLKAESYEM